MKKYIIIVLLFVSFLAFSTEIVGKWEMQAITWEDQSIFLGDIDFYENGTYQITFFDDPDPFICKWFEEDDYFFMGDFGFNITKINDNEYHLLPSFSDPNSKYYILRSK
jgi:hypothetical protein